ncbi:hypothetical protein JCGZ_00717 [Jatropha curcas]|uniref:Protein kinase domain-containing protein n=1 Tax=Jatropha curcas TaxID=180498 RepID=A0A067L383_JATCU|nr:hypothetical protein JCGZ_00717 [Jatropha curcas]
MKLQELPAANAGGNKTDQFALLKFKEGITNYANGTFNSWNKSVPFCNWFGITCSRRHERVTSLVLQGQDLFGFISPYIGNLSFLKLVDLRNNSLHCQIPPEVGNLFRLEQFSVSNNTLDGEIPTNLTRCLQLGMIRLARNILVGKIPPELGSLMMLQVLALSVNNLTGEIPSSLTNLSSLTFLSIAYNNLIGNIPDEVGRLTRLTSFSISVNRISGAIPISFFNISSIVLISAVENHLTGNLPDMLGLAFPSLQNFDIGGNEFSGLIPDSLSNASQIQSIDIAENNFSGKVSVNFGKMKSLQLLQLGSNNLGSNSTNDLMFLTSLVNSSYLEMLDLTLNNFGGVLPDSMSNLSSQLGRLYLGGNEITGVIPVALESLINLVPMDLGSNLFTGPIPSYFGKFQKLRGLALNGNKLSVGKLESIYMLDMSENNLSGEIPNSIGDCLSLEYLHMKGNFFSGILPSAFASLKGLLYLDMSRNNLSGQIPEDLSNLRFLLYLNLSFNDFEGMVPTKGVFGNTSALSLIGNDKLCGGVPQLHLPNCPDSSPTTMKKRNSLFLKLALVIGCVLLCVILILASLVISLRKKSEKKSPSTSLIMEPLINVCKGFLNQIEKEVAIKVLNLEKQGAYKSFMAECKALRNTRQRNLVKLLTYCSSIDYQRNEFKALVFEFIENGSLEKWLHPDLDNENQLTSLNLLQRLSIAMDVASALHHLHEFCETTIIHSDLKPSNVLLDEDMVARASDFGLARLLSTAMDSSQSEISTMGIKGTIGYAAPEYGIGCPASNEGDVYSYGILLLEIFSGKKTH